MYVISSKKFRSLRAAKRQIDEWADKGTLDSKARVYKVEDNNMAFFKGFIIGGGLVFVLFLILGFRI